ncbi:hypothetical protein KCU88_g108, partial [Aureobasidium melanogenum]
MRWGRVDHVTAVSSTMRCCGFGIQRWLLVCWILVVPLLSQTQSHSQSRLAPSPSSPPSHPPPPQTPTRNTI